MQRYKFMVATTKINKNLWFYPQKYADKKNHKCLKDSEFGSAHKVRLLIPLVFVISVTEYVFES